MRHPHPSLRSPSLTKLIAMALLTGCLALMAGCTGGASNEENALPEVNINGGAKRSFTDEELASHDGSGFFPTTFTFEELLEKYEISSGTPTEGGFSAGGYLVQDAPDGSLTPGLYHLNGSQEAMSTFLVYQSAADDEGRYTLKYPIGYFGFSVARFETGDVVLFKPASEDLLMASLPDPSDLGPFTAPYLSGIYQAGIDIPAGTYIITQEPQSAEGLIEAHDSVPGAYIWANLTYGPGSKLSATELPPVAEGGVTEEVTVEEGQYLELFGCRATPKEA